jgi:hypothetical protein
MAGHECQTIEFAEKSLKLRIAGSRPEVAKGENAIFSIFTRSNRQPIREAGGLVFVPFRPANRRRCVALQADYD